MGYISQAAGAFLRFPLVLNPYASSDTSTDIWLENNNEFEHLNRRRAFSTVRLSGISTSTSDDQGFSSDSDMKPCALKDLILPELDSCLKTRSCTASPPR